MDEIGSDSKAPTQVDFSKKAASAQEPIKPTPPTSADKGLISSASYRESIPAAAQPTILQSTTQKLSGEKVIQPIQPVIFRGTSTANSADLTEEEFYDVSETLPR